MKSYKLYLFDLDGTLIDSDQMLIETFHELYDNFRPGFKPSDEYIRQFSGPQIAETLKKEFPNESLEKMLNEYRTRSRRFYDIYVKLFPGVLEMFNKMNQKGIKFAVITNKHRYATDYSYELLGLEKYNIFSICADDVKNLKPAPDGIYETMKHFGIKNKDDVIYIGDGTIDYLTAKNAGVNFGYTAWSPRPIAGNPKIDVNIENFLSFAEEIE